MAKSKLILAYLLLVGVPALGLLGILRAGQKLTSPISVGGLWNLEADFSSLANVPCAPLLSSIKQPFFTISQSGLGLIFIFNDPQRITLPGVINGTTLAIVPQRSPDPTNCGDGGAIYLQATATGGMNQRILNGTLGISGCAECRPIPFRAVRQTASGRGDR